MATVDTIIHRFELDDKQYQHGASRVVHANQKIGASQEMAKAGTKSMVSGLSSLAAMANPTTIALTAVGTALALATAAIGGFGAAYVSLAPDLFKASADFDALRLSIEALEGSASTASDVMKRLREIAKSPGIGPEEAIAGYQKLRNSGIGRGMSMDIIAQMGNAVALGGGGKDQLSRVLLAISQSSTKPFLQGQELMQMSEANVPAYKLLKDAFGTSDTEELKKRGIGSQEAIAGIVAQLALLPRVADGAKNAMENFGSAIDMAKVSAGDAVRETWEPMLRTLTGLIETATTGGVFDDLFSVAMPNGMMSLENGFIKALAAAKTMKDVMVSGIHAFVLGLSVLPNVMPVVGGVLSAIGQAASGGSLGKLYAANEFLLRQKMASGAAEIQKGAPSIAEAFKEAQNDQQTPQIEYLSQIAQNTKEMADISKSSIMGGGAIGAKGIGNVERSALGIGRGATNLDRAVKLIAQHVLDTVLGREMAVARSGRGGRL
jgi:tape measure domain-containing protein